MADHFQIPATFAGAPCGIVGAENNLPSRAWETNQPLARRNLHDPAAPAFLDTIKDQTVNSFLPSFRFLLPSFGFGSRHKFLFLERSGAMNPFVRFVSFAGVVALALLGTLAAWAAITGSISGVVTDPSGAVVPGVKVVATAVSTNVQSTAVTDSKGFYNLPTLSVDTYNLSTSQAGFPPHHASSVEVLVLT